MRFQRSRFFNKNKYEKKQEINIHILKFEFFFFSFTCLFLDIFKVFSNSEQKIRKRWLILHFIYYYIRFSPLRKIKEIKKISREVKFWHRFKLFTLMMSTWNNNIFIFFADKFRANSWVRILTPVNSTVSSSRKNKPFLYFFYSVKVQK